jgi:predicted nuclease of predicted toxin-antitoxin system
MNPFQAESTLPRIAGHDVLYVSELDLLGAADREVMQAVHADKRVLISADTDFGQLLAIGHHPGPSVLIFRRTPHRPEERALVLLAGAVVVFTGDRIRIRHFPIVAEE